METGPKDQHCPRCGRLLPVAGLRSGKIGCKKCRNVYFWDRSTGQLTSLSGTSPARARKMALFAGLAVAAIAIVVLLFLRFQPGQDPGDPDAIIDEAGRHLKSLSE